MSNPYATKPSEGESRWTRCNGVLWLQVRVGIAMCAVFAFSAFLLWWFGWVYFDDADYVVLELPSYSIGNTIYAHFFSCSPVLAALPCMLVILGAMLLVGHRAGR